MVGIPFVGDGGPRRHRRSPALAIQPAGRDPGRGPRVLQRGRNSDALFASESQSLLQNFISFLVGRPLRGTLLARKGEMRRRPLAAWPRQGLWAWIFSCENWNSGYFPGAWKTYPSASFSGSNPPTPASQCLLTREVAGVSLVPSHGPNGGRPITLDQAKVAFLKAWDTRPAKISLWSGNRSCASSD